ncbi:MAG: hypothetical protein RL026_321 [Pseudomonadota bacterium]|jgi:hypothetical protein
MNIDTEFVCEIRALVEAPLVIGQGPKGLRRVVPILGGSFEGPRLKGRIIPGGADWQYVRPDGVLSLEARYTLEVDDGTRIMVVNRGMRHGPPEVLERIFRGEIVPADAYYFRCTPEFEAPAGPHAWLNESIFIGTAERRLDAAIVRVHRVK